MLACSTKVLSGMKPNSNYDTDDVESEQHIGFQVHDVARAFTSAYTMLVKPMGLTRSQARAVAYIARSPGLTQRDLARFLSITDMSTTGLLDRMEQKGLITRGPDATDRRINRVFLTKSAESSLSSIREQIAILTEAATKSIPKRDLDQLSRILNKMESNLESLVTSLEGK